MKPEGVARVTAGMTCPGGNCPGEPQQGAGLVDEDRRGFLRGTVAASVAGLLGGAALAAGGPASAQDIRTPDDALKAMMDGNQRYVGGQLRSLDQDLSLLKAKTAEKQEPFAAVLSCADSRVPVEFIFDQSIGHLFVVRIAGNIATPEIIASLEYGVGVLGTKVLMVLAHSKCGAVQATIDGKAVPGQISALYAPIRPAVDAAGPDLDAVIDANARLQASLLSKASPLIAGAIKDGKAKVVSARYDIASGRVALLA